MTDELQNTWQALDEMEAASSSAGGLTGQITVEAGYKCYISQMKPEDTWFPFKPTDKAGNEAALAKALALNAEHGVTRDPRPHVQFRLSKASVQELGFDVSWAGDRYWSYALWTQAYKQLVKPSLAEHKINVPSTFWGRLAIKQDPTGRQEPDADGNPRIAQVFVVDTVYKDKAEAKAAVGNVASGAGPKVPSDLIVPEGWDAETWWGMRSEIKTALGASPNTAALAKVAKDYGASVPAVRSLIEG